MYECKQCGESDFNKMMSKGNERKCKTLCKACHNLNTIKRGRDNKKEYIDYLGGSCNLCNYNRCDAALEFHHIDPTLKDPTFKSIRYWGLAKAKKELDKCVLLCSNCHREEHAKIEMGDGTAWGGRLPCKEDVQLGSIPRSSTISEDPERELIRVYQENMKDYIKSRTNRRVRL